LKYWGGYGEFFAIPERQLFHLPTEISFEEGAVIADAVVTAVHAVERGHVLAGETVVIVGMGGCGLAAAQICRFYGASIIGVDVTDVKVAHARKYGIDQAVNARGCDFSEIVRNLTGEKGAQCVIDTVGNAATLDQAMRSLCRGGRLVILGYTQERYPLDPRMVAVQELEVIGTRSGGRQSTVNAIQWVSDPRWIPIVTDIFPIEKVNEALGFLRAGEALGRIALTFM